VRTLLNYLTGHLQNVKKELNPVPSRKGSDHKAQTIEFNGVGNMESQFLWNAAEFRFK